MAKSKKVNFMEVQEWDKLVTDTYKRPYNLQQQDGCMERGTIHLIVPDDCADEEARMHDTIPEEVNGLEVGVKFNAWVLRNPNKLTKALKSKWENELFWERNFYPLLQSVANDLHANGLLESGEYCINIDW